MRVSLTAVLALLIAAPLAALAADDVPKAECLACHKTVSSLWSGGKHEGVSCAACHTGLAAHLKDPKTATARPATDMSWQACGTCHKSQLESFLQTSYHRPARDEKSQQTGRSPNPLWDKLMMGHGFTKEHNATRSHAWMLVDQYVVDRAFGGRFQPKDGWLYTVEPAGKKIWDYVKDTYPDNAEQKPFLAQTAAAANAVCLQCKTQEHILDWAYLGDTDKGAKWSRASNVVELARSLNYGLTCNTCHDPHATKPRIVRDALIAALTNPKGDTVWHKDKNHTTFKVVEMGERGYTRKIALLDKADSRLLCAQCHVEYNCNPGTDPKTGEKIAMKDPRTNFMPFKDALGLYDEYVTNIGFLDFQHKETGGLLLKLQHPEAETFMNSVHSQNGVTCVDCHMWKAKGKDGKDFTSHFAVTPRFNIGETCNRCHDGWSEEKARYAIDSVKAYTRGKLRKAEFWLAELIDKIVEAKKAGVGDDILNQAKDQHLRGHILWEYWTAENSDGFHNPALARESLAKSIDESQKGIKILADAMAAKK